MSATMEATATLLHKGTQLMTRDEIRTIEPAIDATRTFKPVPHISLIEAIDNALRDRGFRPTREEFAIGRQGAILFGVMTLDYANIPGVKAALGLRAANDKTMSIQVTVGTRVLVCDNMCFSSDGIALRKKHAASLDLDRQMLRAVDTFAGRYLTMEKRIELLQGNDITDERARSLMHTAFEQKLVPLRLLPDVSKNYFEPPHEEFQARNMWSLHNAFSEAMKQMEPIPAHRSNMKLAQLFGLQTVEAK